MSGKWTPEQERWAWTFGLCEICRAPRRSWTVRETDGYRSGMVCSEHPEHGPDVPPEADR